MATKQCAVLAGPVLGAGASGRPRWEWRVERTVGSDTHAVPAGSKSEAKRIAQEVILDAIAAGFTVHARFVEQTGYAQSGVYHPDGRMTDVTYHTPKDGLLGPRCFELPFTVQERKVRASAMRPKKPQAEDKPAASASGGRGVLSC